MYIQELYKEYEREAGFNYLPGSVVGFDSFQTQKGTTKNRQKANGMGNKRS